MFRKKNIINRLNYEKIYENIKSSRLDHNSNAVVKLMEKIKHSKITSPEKVRPNVITIDTRFRLKNLGNGIQQEYALVMSPELDENFDCICFSVFEEQGAEIFSREVGDVVCLDSSGGYYQIENILYQPEAAGVFQA